MDRGVTPLKRVISPIWGTPKGGFICNIRIRAVAFACWNFSLFLNVKTIIILFYFRFSFYYYYFYLSTSPERGASNFHGLVSRRFTDQFIFWTVFSGANFEYLLNSTNQSAKP